MILKTFIVNHLHKVLILVVFIDHFWRRIVEWQADIKNAEAFFGRRKGDRKMDIAAIIALVEHGVPALEAGWAAAEPLIATETQDVKDAFDAGKKAFEDLKGAIPVVVAAIKAGAAGQAPAKPAA